MDANRPCPLHAGAEKTMDDHEERLRHVEAAVSIDEPRPLCARVRDIEDWVLVAKTKAAVYGAVGALAGGFAFQFLTKYVLHW